jgi:hypothetical protein
MGLIDDASAAWSAESSRREAEARRKQAEADIMARPKGNEAIAAIVARHEEPARRVMNEWAARLRVNPQDMAIYADPSAKKLTLRRKADGHVFCVIGTQHGTATSVLIEREVPEHLSSRLFYVKRTVLFAADTLEQIGFALTDQALLDKDRKIGDAQDQRY